jgi:hypothetical protein
LILLKTAVNVKKKIAAGHGWLTSVILATQEAESRRIGAGGEPKQIVLKDPVSKRPLTKKGVVEGLKVKALSSSPSTTNK